MRGVRWLAVAAIALWVAAAAAGGKRPEPVRFGSAKKADSGSRAVAVLEGRSGSAMKGEATFVKNGLRVTFHLVVEGAPPGPHGVHLHERGDCSSPDALSAGPHWNPTGEAHGRWGHPPFHRGDLGNVEIGADGKGSLTLTTDLWTIGGDPTTGVLNRAVVVHEAADDFVTQPTGNAGARIACGVVRLEN